MLQFSYDNLVKKKEKQKGFLVEKFISKPFLMSRVKFVFKYYLIIVRSSPLIVLYRQAYIEACSQRYGLDFKNSINQRICAFTDRKS